MTITIYNGNSKHVLAEFDENSIDAFVTDPPYGLSKEPDIEEVLTKWADGEEYESASGGFMGKTWDSFVPNPNLWREAYRTLRPGGYLLAFAGTRTQGLMATSIEMAGFRICDQISWAYGCLSEDSEVLTRNGWEHYHTARDKEVLTYDHQADIYEWERPSRWCVYRVESDTAYRIQSDHTDQIVSRGHRCLVERSGKLTFVSADELAEVERVPYLQGDISSLPKADRELLLKAVLREGEGLAEAICVQRQGEEVPGQGVERPEEPCVEGRCNSLQTEREVFGPVDQVCSMSGSLQEYGKERWVRHGTSSDCSDGDRAPAVEKRVRASHQPRCDRQQDRQSDAVCDELRPQEIRARTTYRTTLATITPIEYTGLIFCPTVSTGAFVARRNGKVFITGNSGFPKSLDVSKAIDKAGGAEREVVGANPNHRAVSGVNYEGVYAGSNTGSAVITAPATEAARQWSGWGTALKPAHEPVIVACKPYEDGSLPAAHTNWLPFHYVAKAAKRERNRGCEGLFWYKPNTKEGNKGPWIQCTAEAWKAMESENKAGEKPWVLSQGNNHPTVKPAAIMKWLVDLLPEDARVVCDPFMGSGSTGLACKASGRDFIGIEMDENSVIIAKARTTS